MQKGLLIAAVVLLAVNGAIGVWQLSVLQNVSRQMGSTYIENWPDSLNVDVKDSVPLVVEVHPEMSRAIIDPKTFRTLVPSQLCRYRS